MCNWRDCVPKFAKGEWKQEGKESPFIYSFFLNIFFS